MKVVIDINSVLPLYSRGWISGIGRSTKDLVECMSTIDDLPFDVVLYSQNTKGVSGMEIGTHFKCCHLPLPHRPWMNRIVGATHLREIVTKYDLLHIPHNFEWVRCPERTVVTLHDAMFFSMPDEVFNYKYYQKTYPRLARKSKAIITCSESSKRDIVKYMDVSDEKIHVIPWGYDSNIFFPREKSEKKYPYFLSVSCSLGRKNTFSVIKAYEKLHREYPTHHYILVWPNVPKTVPEYCKNHGLNDKIHIMPGVDYETLARLYSGASAFFYPSRYEGFGSPIIESMACGTPVVTCSNSALPEVGGNVAIYVEPDDIEGIYNIMCGFENKQYDISSLKEKCLKQASKFSMLKCTKQYINLFHKLL